jgi:hypothetical protein
MRHAVVIASLLAAQAALGEPLELTLEEFKMYQHYLNAMEDPRVQKMKPESRMGAIARDAGFKLRDLQRAIDRGQAAGDIKGKCEGNIKEALGKTELAGRVGQIEVDTKDPHAVAYVQWFNENLSQLEEEASLTAAATKSSCPVVSTVQVWAQAKDNPKTRVFQALISGSAAANIKPERAKDFAKTRYIRLFEKVRSLAAGDDFPDSNGAPGK